MARILIVEDNQDVLTQVKIWLRAEGFEAEGAECGIDAQALIAQAQFDLLILDWELPDMTGLSLLEGLRRRGFSQPVLMLTGRSSETEKEIGLDAGADDYMVKPYSLKELSARVRALLRRPPLKQSSLLVAGAIELDNDSRQVRCAGELVELRPLEFALLEFLMKNPGKVYTSEKLINSIWPAGSDSGEEAVRSVIRQIRQKLDATNKESVIKTVHGLGYRLNTDTGN